MIVIGCDFAPWRGLVLDIHRQLMMLPSSATNTPVTLILFIRELALVV